MRCSGWSEQRASHAELVAVPADQLTVKPESGARGRSQGRCSSSGMAALASVKAGRAAGRRDGRRLRRPPAASAQSQFSSRGNAGATVIGLAGRSEPRLAACATASFQSPTATDRPSESARQPQGKVDAFIDTFGGGYVELAIELGVSPDRINTIIDQAAAARLGVARRRHASGRQRAAARRARRAGRRGAPGDTDRKHVPARAGASGVHRVGRSAYTRQDRADSLVACAAPPLSRQLPTGDIFGRCLTPLLQRMGRAHRVCSTSEMDIGFTGKNGAWRRASRRSCCTEVPAQGARHARRGSSIWRSTA